MYMYTNIYVIFIKSRTEFNDLLGRQVPVKVRNKFAHKILPD